MPAKYSHVKKRSASGLLKKNGQGTTQAVKDIHLPANHGHNHHSHGHSFLHGRGHGHGHGHHKLNPLVDRSLSKAMNTVAQLEPKISELEHAIARILLIRYDNDIARLFSTHVYTLSLVQLPTFVMRCLSLGGPSWLAWNYNSEEIKDFFRAVISMDMRQAGERVATKSVLWSYTALRQFAMTNNVPICAKRGLHSLRLLPYYSSLKAHLDTLEELPDPTFSKPPHLGSLQEGQSALEDACELKYGRINGMLAHPEWDESSNWREKVRYGYEKVSQTLWRVAREFDVSGYGLVLREKLTSKWCGCGCSTDHLGEVCERTVREDEEESGVRLGKRREWDGRGSGVHGWETEQEEDIWEIDLDFGGMEPVHESETGGIKLKESDMSIGEIMEYRYLRAEKEKEKGNTAFRKGDFELAVKHYEAAFQIEPELPHYQLNLAQAHIKLNHWIEVEQACAKALGQHHSSKGYYRRARARRMLGRPEEAIKDLRAVLRIQPNNTEAINELMSLIPPISEMPSSPTAKAAIPIPASPSSSSSSSSSSSLFPSSSSSSSSTSSSSSPSPSTSSSSSPSSSSRVASSTTPNSTTPKPPTSPEQDLFSRLGISKPKKLKDPPFTRVRNDSRRLKIVMLPSSNVPFPPPLSPESFSTIAGFECEHGVGCAHWRERERALMAEKAKSANVNGSGTEKDGKGKGKARVKSERAKEIEKMKGEGMSYPSWDRYVVKLV